jgi:xenotropic and polytropic retrovirus receptor 1
MVTNVIIRFIWIGYIPLAGLEYRSRAFTFAMLEMLRRWQWNFFRVETEQVGNTDQYRISKDVPLPYRLEPDESEDEMVRTIDQRSGRERWGWRSAAVTMDRLRKRVVSGAKEEVREVREAYHHGARGPPGTINAGPRGVSEHMPTPTAGCSTGGGLNSVWTTTTGLCVTRLRQETAT